MGTVNLVNQIVYLALQVLIVLHVHQVLDWIQEIVLHAQVFVVNAMLEDVRAVFQDLH